MTAKPLPHLSLLWEELLHYDPIAGRFTYLQQRGPKAIGDEAGATIRGIPYLFFAGSYHSAAAVAWALTHGADPAPLHVIPIDGNPLNLKAGNLALSQAPFSFPRVRRRPARRARGLPTVRVRFCRTEGMWKARHQNKPIGSFITKKEAIAAKLAYIEEERQRLEREMEDDDM